MTTLDTTPSVNSAEQRLKALGIELPVPPEPFGTYAEAVQTGKLLFLTGMLPTEGLRATFTGRIGAEIDVEGGRKAARLAALNALAVVSHDADRWAVHLLPRGWAKRRADAPAPPRTTLLVTDVRAPLRPAFRSLSPGRARLPGLRAQRLAGPEEICLHVRPLRRDHESLRRSARALALHAVHAGLRRPRGVSHGVSPSGAHRGPHRPGRGGAQRRPGGELEAAAGFLGRSRRQRKHAAHPSPVAADDADAPCRKRS